jgi:hypothetical protein
MRPAKMKVHFLSSERSFPRTIRSGVSLHSHTEHSAESLQKFPEQLKRMPIVGLFTKREIQRYQDENGKLPEFDRAFWRGPLTAQSAYQLEASQIERLDLRALVSLTDHDNVDAGLILRAATPVRDIPISVEWTVPFENSIFHVGIHNIAPDSALAALHKMADYTRCPDRAKLGALFEEFSSDPNTLTVLNHPLWDIGGVGSAEIGPFVHRFLKVYGDYVHALEVNGLRSRKENADVVSLAASLNCPAISGGDRHGLEPNANINVTRAESFADFVREIREERISEIAMMPQYREPLVLRHFLTAWDAVREHTQAGRGSWLSRIFVRCEDGVVRPLSSIWTDGAPAWIDPCLRIVGLLANPTLRAPFRLAAPLAGSAVL